MKKLRVDQNSCIGCGLCNATFPDAFNMTDDGYAEVVAELDDDQAQEAIDNCPAAAIEEE